MDPFEVYSAQEALFNKKQKKRTRKSFKKKILIMALVIAVIVFIGYNVLQDKKGFAYVPVVAAQGANTQGVDKQTGKATSTAPQEQALTVFELSDTAKGTGGTCVVYITGAVTSPGLFTLPSADRIGDAVNEAGGFKENAAIEAVNLAEQLVDGMHIHIPTAEEFSLRGSGSTTPSAQNGSGSQTTGSNTAQSSTLQGKVNINTADSTTLQTLTGIGPATAQKIIDYRNAHGPFKSKEELKNVSGIGEKKYADIADRITV